MRALHLATIFTAALLYAVVITGHAQPTNQQRQSVPLKPLFPNATPVCPCESLTNVPLPNTLIDSAQIDPYNGWCRVTATVTHPPSGDRVKVFIGLPVTNWNGRFQGNGGGGFSGGSAGIPAGELNET